VSKKESAVAPTLTGPEPWRPGSWTGAPWSTDPSV